MAPQTGMVISQAQNIDVLSCPAPKSNRTRLLNGSAVQNYSPTFLSIWEKGLLANPPAFSPLG